MNDLNSKECLATRMPALSNNAHHVSAVSSYYSHAWSGKQQ